MSDESIWMRLGLLPCRDKKQIKRAFAARIKQIDQELEPAAFQAMREAYEAALAFAASEVESDPSEQAVTESDQSETAVDPPPLPEPVSLSPAQSGFADVALIMQALFTESEDAALALFAEVLAAEKFQDQDHAAAFERYLAVALLEIPNVPFSFLEEVFKRMNWTENNAYHPLFFEKQELALIIKAEALKAEIEAALKASEPQTDREKAMVALFGSFDEDQCKALWKGRMKDEIKDVMEEISCDVTGRLEALIRDNPSWIWFVEQVNFVGGFYYGSKRNWIFAIWFSAVYKVFWNHTREEQVLLFVGLMIFFVLVGNLYRMIKRRPKGARYVAPGDPTLRAPRL